MIESTINSNEFRSKYGTVVRIPDADFNIVPRSVTKNTTPNGLMIQTSDSQSGLYGPSGVYDDLQGVHRLEQQYFRMKKFYDDEEESNDEEYNSKESRERVKDDKRSGHQQTSARLKTSKKVSSAVPKNRLQRIEGSIGISSATYVNGY
ncbi:hypothetical protein TNCV_2375021 [Trichonephila clavipes]|nr:hypothetical protein TNCV_2375021 [Trichonephila clavipes]